MEIDTPEVARRRGRIVMLVDNGVRGDSRVQKSAEYAARAGWDVILLGRGSQPQTWRIGDAEVRLVKMTPAMAKPRHTYRRRVIRGPLAYPPTGVAAFRSQWIKAWRADLEVRRSELALDQRSGRARAAALRQAALRAESVAAKVAGRWVSLRHWQLNRAPRDLDGPWDRLVTRFWQAAHGDRAWRRLYPHLWDFELAYGPVIDELKPDLIHANDFRMLGVGARAAVRARARGRQVRLVWDAHEFLPGIRPVPGNARRSPALQAHEREYAPYADAVVTVSDTLAEMLQREHRLSELPTVVLNAPVLGETPAGDGAEPAPDLRGQCGIGPEVPLLVYSGAAAKQRGLDIMVEALPQLADAHVALVVNEPTGAYVTGLVARARQLGVADRVHVLPYVAYWQVVPFLAGADVGVIPIHHWPNHEIALITKFFEYSHARLPLVVSDVRTMAETVRSTGQGEVFRAEDVADYVRVVRSVLADRDHYRAAYDQPGLLETWTWDAQAEILDGVYRRLLPQGAGDRESTGASR